VAFIAGNLFRTNWTGSKATVTSVVADPLVVNDADAVRIRVVNSIGIDARNVAVIYETAVVPIATLVSHAVIAMAVIHAAIKADVRTPESVVP
jgi:hypothetical protein